MVERDTYTSRRHNTHAQGQRTSRDCVISVSSPCQSQQRTLDSIGFDKVKVLDTATTDTKLQSQTRTEQAAWLTVQLRDQHTTNQGIPAIPTAKVIAGRICISTYTPLCMSCSKVDFSVYDSFTLT